MGKMFKYIAMQFLPYLNRVNVAVTKNRFNVIMKRRVSNVCLSNVQESLQLGEKRWLSIEQGGCKHDPGIWIGLIVFTNKIVTNTIQSKLTQNPHCWFGSKELFQERSE